MLVCDSTTPRITTLVKVMAQMPTGSRYADIARACVRALPDVTFDEIEFAATVGYELVCAAEAKLEKRVH